MSLSDKYYPWAKILPRKIAVNAATLGILGRMKAPGTWGSAAGALLYLIFFSHLGFQAYLLFAALLIYAAMGICDSAEEHLKMRDPGCIVLDEFAAMQLCFLPLPVLAGNITIWTVILGFLLFRFFDITKPFGIKKLQDIEGGAGCVLDDVAAALLTWVCLYAINAFEILSAASQKSS